MVVFWWQAMKPEERAWRDATKYNDIPFARKVFVAGYRAALRNISGIKRGKEKQLYSEKTRKKSKPLNAMK